MSVCYFFVLLLAHGLKCMICLVEFSEGEDMKEMPCCHLFHPCCILPWLDKVHYSRTSSGCTVHCVMYVLILLQNCGKNCIEDERITYSHYIIAMCNVYSPFCFVFVLADSYTLLVNSIFLSLD